MGSGRGTVQGDGRSVDGSRVMSVRTARTLMHAATPPACLTVRSPAPLTVDRPSGRQSEGVSEDFPLLLSLMLSVTTTAAVSIAGRSSQIRDADRPSLWRRQHGPSLDHLVRPFE